MPVCTTRQPVLYQKGGNGNVVVVVWGTLKIGLGTTVIFKEPWHNRMLERLQFASPVPESDYSA